MDTLQPIVFHLSSITSYPHTILIRGENRLSSLCVEFELIAGGWEDINSPHPDANIILETSRAIRVSTVPSYLY